MGTDMDLFRRRGYISISGSHCIVNSRETGKYDSFHEHPVQFACIKGVDYYFCRCFCMFLHVWNHPESQNL